MKLAGKTIRKIFIMLVLVSFAQVSLISNIGHASIVDSKMIMSKFNESGTREIDEKKVRRMLENKILSKRLKSYGLSNEEIYSKIEAMSDEQVHQLASLSDSIPAGGDAGAAALIVIVVIAVAIILLLVLVVLNRKG
jgi:hypothetical protein